MNPEQLKAKREEIRIALKDVFCDCPPNKVGCPADCANCWLEFLSSLGVVIADESEGVELLSASCPQCGLTFTEVLEGYRKVYPLKE